MALIIAELDGVFAKAKSGHLEIEISGKRLNDFKNMSIEDQMEYLEEEADFIPHSIDYEFNKITKLKILE